MSDKNFNGIKIVFAEKNLSYKYLTEKLGRDQSSILKWVKTTLETLIQIAQCLDVNVQELIRFS